MSKEHAKKILVILDRVNQELDLLGNIIMQNKLKPIPVPVEHKNRRWIE
ncbi:MAG: hypothetical protein MI975_04975 [Cytophagales bacterium]|nr:hypothetical protein [Cytophagales bacterium]